MKLWKKSKYLLLVAIILFLSIGFAILTVNLNIEGSFTFKKNEWNIHFDNIVINSGSISDVLPTISDGTLNFTTSFHSPSEYYSFNVDVVNSGTLDAMVDSVTISGINDNSKYVNCTVNYNNGTAISKNDILYAGYSTDLTVKVLYKDISLEEIPKDNINLDITISINYKQANGDAKLIADTNFIRYDYTGSEQAFTPVKNGTYKIELWGASGGGSDHSTNYGAYVSGNIDLKKTDILYAYVGARGGTIQSSNTINRYGTFNIGGYGKATGAHAPERIHADGGGATDIRLANGDWKSFDSLKTRIMVAAGAGGLYESVSTTSSEIRMGGPGGGLIGYDGGWNPNDTRWGTYGSGATQLEGGYCYCIEDSICAVDNGAWGFGTDHYGVGGFGTGGISPQIGSQGGGSGYYGGGSSFHVQGAGGGSSFISGHAGCVAISEDSEEANIKQKTVNEEVCTDNSKSVECSKHYSGKYFTNTVMIDGKGYKWTTEKASNSTGMPKYIGTGIETGHNGNGKAKITIMK